MLFKLNSLMRWLRILSLLITTVTLSSTAMGQSRHFPSGTHEVYIANANGVRTNLLQNISPIMEKSIADGYYPGAVVLIGHKGKIIYRGIFGNRRIIPNVAPMRFDTIFDIASLTKVVATTPAIMQLVEQGKLDLDAPVAKYWPAFGKNQKKNITIRELLTHTSGLPPEIPSLTANVGKNNILTQIIDIKPQHLAGKNFLYSDVNFIVLAHLVEIIAQEDINQYTLRHIFKPLKMRDTGFLPAPILQDRIAPTELVDKKLRWGKVQDPAAQAMGGVSGNAGLFSTANDLGIYVQSLLDGGRLPEEFQDGNNRLTHFLGPLAIEKMTTQQTPSDITDTRGLGWDIDSAYSNRGVLFPVRSFGHTGWTGTSIWIDPTTQTWIIVLTSRAHPTPAKNNQLIQDRRMIANIVSASIVDIKNYSFNNTGKGELTRAFTKKNS